VASSRVQFGICAYPRLHVTLLDLCGDGYRRNGGVGFSVGAPRTRMEFITSEKTDVSVLASVGFSESEISKLSVRLDTIMTTLHFDLGIKILECNGLLRHVGFGSGTATTLACIEALLTANEHPIEKVELQRLSGRGGASGVGINTYFEGGLSFDAGRAEDGTRFLPSGAAYERCPLPIVLTAAPMPSWDIGLLILGDVGSPSAAVEQRLFDITCPLSRQDVYEVIYHATFGLVASVLTEDFESFCASINAIQGCVWKRAEINAYGQKIVSLINQLRRLGCDAVGLSSLGPAVYFFSSDFEQVFGKIRMKFPNSRLIRTQPRNQGRETVIV
jgi:beta-ribofuranosylaminobenzene 5'-phosphate synthase